MSGTLTLVATPIGHLGDLSYRAVEALRSADLIACEDTRRSRVLLDHYGVKKPLTSYHDYSERRKAPELVEKVKSGLNVALVSDAGTPGVADPGFRLVRAALEAGVRVEAVPGPSAFVMALVLSGLPTDRFAFEGFLPVKDGARKKRLAEAKGQGRTVVYYESPHRLKKSLAAIVEVFGPDAPVAVARELTKKFEEVVRGRAADVERTFASREILGEFVIVAEPDPE